jgi:hypothetical protein
LRRQPLSLGCDPVRWWTGYKGWRAWAGSQVTCVAALYTHAQPGANAVLCHFGAVVDRIQGLESMGRLTGGEDCC